LIANPLPRAPGQIDIVKHPGDLIDQILLLPRFHLVVTLAGAPEICDILTELLQSLSERFKSLFQQNTFDGDFILPSLGGNLPFLGVFQN
jgi:hypothetical protein